MKSVSKLFLGLILGLLLALPVSVYASTIDGVRTTLNDEYKNKNVTDMTVRDNLIVICNNIEVKRAVLLPSAPPIFVALQDVIIF